MNAIPWRILLVEDDEDDFVLTRFLLTEAKGANFELVWVKTYADARHTLLSDECLDAALVDYRLGASDGLALARDVIAQGCQVPMILLTGKGSYDVDVEAMKAGVSDYLVKGELSSLLLERAIRYAIERKQAGQNLRRAYEELELRVLERTQDLMAEIAERKRAENALNETNALLEKAFSSVHLLIAYMDTSFNFIRVNSLYAEADGLTPEDYVGKNHFDLYPNPENEVIFRNVVETGEPYFVFSRAFVYAGYPERGVTYWDWSLQPVKEPDGKVSGLVLSLIDVTDRVRVKLALQEQGEQLRKVVTGAPVVLWAMDRDGTITLCEGKGLAALGLLPAQVVGKNMFEYFSGWLDKDCIQKALAGEEVIAVAEAVGVTNEVVETRYAPHYYAGGGVVGVIGVSTIITDRVRAEEAMQASKNMFEGLFESAPDATLVVDPHGTILRVNRRVYDEFGYQPEELVGRPVEVLLPEPMQNSHVPMRERYHRHPSPRPMGTNHDFYGLHKDGREIPLDITLSPLESDGGMNVICVIRDITRRKEAEQALREKDRLIETAVTGLPLSLFVANRKGKISLFLGNSLDSTREAKTMIGGSILSLYGDASLVEQDFHRVLAGETCTSIVEAFGRVFDARYAPLYGEKGNVTGVIGVTMDVTAHRQAEDDLRKSEARFRTIFEESALGIKLKALDGKILASNLAFQEMLGYSEEDLRGMGPEDFTETADLRAEEELFAQLIAGKNDRYRIEKRYHTREGARLWTRSAVSLVKDEAGRPQFVISMVENITDRRQMEAELAEVQRRLMDSREAERLQLAQELHDGPMQHLYGVSYQIKSVQDELEGCEYAGKLGHLQGMIHEVIQVLRILCGELRPPTLAPFGLEKTIRSHAAIFQREHTNIELQLDLAPDGQELSEPVRLALFRIYQQALANVVRHSKANRVSIRFAMDAETIQLEIRDYGVGFVVPERWIDLVREGHLGLAGASERAGAIGGRLEVESHTMSGPEAGTLMRVVVPRINES